VQALWHNQSVVAAEEVGRPRFGARICTPTEVRFVAGELIENEVLRRHEHVAKRLDVGDEHGF